MEVPIRFEGGFAPDPVPLLRELRAEALPPTLLLAAEPSTEAERNYLLLFEEFRPRIKVVSGSGLSATSSLTYPLKDLEIPASGLTLPVCGDFFQSMCDYTITTKEHYDSIAWYIEAVAPPVPRERILFIEEGVPAEVLEKATSLFVYPVPGAAEPVFEQAWRSLRLIVCHSSDNTLPAEVFTEFLDANPQITLWAANNTTAHPQVRTLPLAEQGAFWRRGGSSGEALPPAEDAVAADPPVPVLRTPWSERTTEMFGAWRPDTSVERPIWYDTIRSIVAAGKRRDIQLYRYLEKEDYDEFLRLSKVVLCPPGNGYDTHRLWETLYRGGWPVVQACEHTAALQREYPSLPLLSIVGPQELAELIVPAEGPSPFHPMLLREFWRILKNSHTES